MDVGFISLILCEGLLMVFGIYLIGSWINKTPFYPSSLKRLNKLYTEGKITIPKGSRFIDIGSGDGRIVLWASRKGAIAEGIEFNPFLSLISRILLLINRPKNKTLILNKNFKNHSFQNYDIVYMYIFPEHMSQIKNKLFNELPKGAKIITNTFNIKDVEHDEKIDRFYIYNIK